MLLAASRPRSVALRRPSCTELHLCLSPSVAKLWSVAHGKREAGNLKKTATHPGSVGLCKPVAKIGHVSGTDPGTCT